MKVFHTHTSKWVSHSFILFPISLLLILGFSIFIPQVEATTVPLSQTVIGLGATFDLGIVYSADIDGDGDMDVVGAGTDSIRWYENTIGDGSIWAQHAIKTGYTGAHGCHIGDLDGDGSIDVVGAAVGANTISWFDNVNGDGSSWFERVLSNTFTGASGVYVIDLDKDGDLDIVGGTQSGAGRVAWWENTNGFFSTFSEHAIDNANQCFAPFAADIDKDGDIDIVGGSAAASPSLIIWWESDGTPLDGGWTKHTIYTPVGTWSCGVYAYDIDRDGDLDVIGTVYADNDVIWFESTPSGAAPPADPITWIKHDIDTNFGGASWVDIADFNQDGYMDIVGASYGSDDAAWWENDGTPAGGFIKHTIFNGSTAPGIHGIAAGDINGDGNADIIVPRDGAAELSWWKNLMIHRSELFVDSGQSIGSLSSRDVALADLDEDGDLDAFVVNTNYPTSQPNKVFSNDGSGNFTDTGQSLGNSHSYGVGLGDLDGDGDLDAFVANYGSGNEVWLNDGSGTFSDSGQSLGTSNSLDVALGDLDSDGDLDAFVANVGVSGQPNKVWLNDGSGIFSDSGQNLGSESSYAVGLGDLDSDGDLDAFVVNYDPPSGQPSKVWLNDGAGTFSDSGQSLSHPASYDVALGDLDKDGDLDAFVVNFNDQPNKVWLNDGSGTFSDSGQSLGSESSRAVALGDLDNDGDLDAFVANQNQPDKVWLNDGSGNFSDSGQSLGNSNGMGVALGDIESDGDLDAFVCNVSNQADNVWLNRGGQFALPTTNTAPGLFLQGATDDVLKIVATHRGRTLDTDMELVTLELLFEETPGEPLSEAEANALIAKLWLYLDDGSGIFESGSDTTIVSGPITPLTLTAGVLTIAFSDADPNVQVAFGTPKTYFVVVELKSDAKAQTPNQFRISHLTQSTSTGEDRDNDLPLILEYAVNVPSSLAPAETIADIAAARAVSGAVLITGTVTLVSDYDGLNSLGHQFAIQDTSGTDGRSAIMVLDTGNVISNSTNYTVGNTLSGVGGNRTATNGMEQLVLTVDPGAPGAGSAPTPLLVALPIADINAIEAELIKINGLSTTAIGNYLAGTDYTYSISGNDIVVRVEAGSQWVGDLVQPGPIDITGIAAQDLTTNQILPRYDIDLPITNWMLY